MSGNNFWVVGECVCGLEMAMREGAPWPACPKCGGDIRPPAPDMDGITVRARSNGRKGLFSPVYPEQIALALARGWDVPDMDRVVAGFVEQRDRAARESLPPFRRVV